MAADPMPRRVWRTLESALKRGTIDRPKACGECGKDCKPDAHHDDYSKPLAVRWLCRSCHKNLHSTTEPHPDRAVLEQIGDANLIAEGVPPHCVKQWKYRGVPWNHRAKIARIAKARRIKVPADFAEVRPEVAA